MELQGISQETLETLTEFKPMHTRNIVVLSDQ